MRLAEQSRTQTNVCLVGVGLIGGSLGMALRNAGKNGKRSFVVTGLGRRLSELRLAKKRGAVDSFFTDPKKCIPRADLVVLCVPVQHIAGVLKRIKPFLKNNSVVTDVGSVKEEILKQADAILKIRKDVSFVGGHPIAGTEKTGVRNAQFDLFQKTTCVLVSGNATFSALTAVKEMWNAAGATCVLVPAQEHDRILALTSHLPHLLAFSFFDQVLKTSKTNALVRKLVGGSFKDMTRIAGANPDMWRGILKMNKKEIGRAAQTFESILRFYASNKEANVFKALTQLAHSKKSWVL